MQTIEFKLRIIPLSNKLLRFAGQILKNNVEAQDVVQDTFLKIWDRKDDLDKIDNMDAFAMRMVRNRCLDLLRARQKLRVGDEELWLKKEEAVEHDQVEMGDTTNRIRMMVGKLPEQQQTVMYLRDFECKEYDEIEEVTGLNANAIRVNLSRARKKVRDELLKTWKNETERNKNIAGEIF